jgi:hypothetical protein
MRLLPIAALSLVFVAGCHHHSTSGGGNNDLSGLGDAGTNGDGGNGDLSGVVNCGLTGAACASGGDCCSNMCDPMNNICLATTATCKNDGDSCTVPTDCCNLQCNGGTCSPAGQCIADNAACGAGVTNSCCSGTCGANNTCTPLNTTCKTAGNPCTPTGGDAGGGGGCCSGLCANGVCALQASYCTQVGDVCYRPADCCTGVCNIAGGAIAGTCAMLNSPVSCAIDGTICDGCGGCCSRLCAPYAASGRNICQPASGCHVFGDLCRKNSDCCGGEPLSSGLPGASLVVCTLISGAGGIGYCDHPSSSNGGAHTCDPEGGVCHFKNYACSNSSDRNDCCACISSKSCCQLDPLGIPRCNAINPADGGTCVPRGGACSFDGDCCGGAPCVPNSMGQLTCGIGTDGGSCVPAGGPCTTTADCCTGVTCFVSPGALSGTCESVTVPGVGDGGVRDLAGPPPICAEIGQSCESVACCQGLTCFGPSGACGATGAGCTCIVVVQ